MILKLFHILLLHGVCLCLQSMQNFDWMFFNRNKMKVLNSTTSATIWSMPTDSGNGLYQSHNYNTGVFHPTEISQINNLAHLDCEKQNYKRNLPYNNIDNGSPAVSKEELYVFLDKGRTRYMPMNEHEKTIIKHSPMNVNGRDVHLPDIQVLQNVGLNHAVLNDETHNPYSYFQSNPDSHGKKPNNYDIPVQNEQNHHRNLHLSPNTMPNNYIQKNIHQYQTPHMRKQEALRKFNCKNQNIVKNRPTYSVNNEHYPNKPKFIRDCKPKKKNEFSNTRSKAIIHQTEHRVEFKTSEIILGSTHNQSGSVGNNVSGKKSFGEQHTRNGEKSFTTIHQGIINVSSPKDVVITTNNTENEDLNKSLEDLFKNDEGNDIIIAAQTESPMLGSTLMTDSPIIRIKIMNTTKNELNEGFPKGEKSNIFDATKSSKDLSNDGNKNTESAFNDEEDSKNQSQSEPEIENDLEKDTTIAPTTESQELIITTEMTELNTSESLPTENTDRSTDLAESEDRLYAYVTKLEKKSRKSRKRKVSPKQDRLKYTEPIAYESYLMETSKKPTKPKTGQKKRYTPKPKRFVQLHALNPNLNIRKLSWKTTEKYITTSTMTPQILTTKSKLFPEGLKTEDYYQNYPEKSYSKKIGNTPQQNIGKSNSDMSNSQLLGSSRFPSDDPCIDNGEDIQNFHKHHGRGSQNLNELHQHHGRGSQNTNGYQKSESNFYDSQEFGLGNNDSSQNGFGESDIHGIQGDCSDSTEVKFDGDQYFDVVENVTPASRNTFSDLC